nr:flagellar biosynthetic protein FliR [Granulicella rosea]
MRDAARDWPHYLSAGLLVMIRLSGVVAFAPIFSSQSISPRVKAGFVVALACLLAPAVALLPGARVTLDMSAILGELAVGLVFGFSLTLLTEALDFAGALLGMSFSFSLVNLLDPNSHVETALMSQFFNLLSTLIMIAAGLDRTLLSAVVRSFRAVPVGDAALQATTAASLAEMAGGIFLAGLQLAAPVLAAALAVEMTVSMVSRLAPQLPAMVMSIPLKTMTSYAVLVASLAVWPWWIERHFTALLDAAEHLLVKS